jgi:hypothetical protein
MAIEFDTFVVQRKLSLPNIRYASLIKLEAQAFLVSAFQQARPKLAMHLNRKPNNLSRQTTIIKVVQRDLGALCGSVVDFLYWFKVNEA